MDVVESGVGVLDDVVQCAGDHDRLVAAEPMENQGHGRGVLEIGDVASLASLATVAGRRPAEGAFQILRHQHESFLS